MRAGVRELEERLSRRARGLLVWLAAGWVACGCGAHPGADPGSGHVALEQESEQESSPAPGEAAEPEGDRPAEAGERSERFCRPYPPPSGRVIRVGPDRAGELAAIVSRAERGDTIALADGTYRLEGAELRLATPSVTLRSESGDREGVILEAGYQSGEPVVIQASGVVVADLTIARAGNHGVHIYPPPDGQIRRIAVYNVVVLDPGQQAIKVNQHGTGYADEGIVACSRLELTDAGRRRVMEINGSCYTGGVDVHRARDWVVRDNHIEGFWCPADLSQHGIHFWTGSRDTLVERNVVVDCARGIGFGLAGGGEPRRYDDAPCGSEGDAQHYGGIIRNNFVFASRPELFASQSGFDAGISLWSACGARVLHNTVVSTSRPFASIEWRFPNTRFELTNNLVSHNLMPRQGAAATRAGNIENAPLSLFVNGRGGDLHLAPSASAAIDHGVPVPGDACDRDIDGDRRDQRPDVGADERF